MPKFTFEERNSIKNIVAISSLKRILDKEIINEVQKLTGAHISRQYLFRINEPKFSYPRIWLASLEARG